MCSLFFHRTLPHSRSSSCSALALVHTGCHRMRPWCTSAVDRVDRDRLSSVDRLAWDTEGSAAPPSRVHFVSTRLIPRGEWRRSIGMRQRPMQQYSSSRMRCEYSLSRSAIGSRDVGKARKRRKERKEKKWKWKDNEKWNFNFSNAASSARRMWTARARRQSYQLTLGQSWKYSSPTTFSFSKNSTVCHKPMAPLASKHEVSMRIAVAVMAPAERLQQPALCWRNEFRLSKFTFHHAPKTHLKVPWRMQRSPIESWEQTRRWRRVRDEVWWSPPSRCRFRWLGNSQYLNNASRSVTSRFRL